MKRRAFGGWVISTTPRSVALRGWYSDAVDVTYHWYQRARGAASWLTRSKSTATWTRRTKG